MERIIEYRNARTAVEWANDTEEGHKHFKEHPQLLVLLKDMGRAMAGKPVTEAAKLALERSEGLKAEAQ